MAQSKQQLVYERASYQAEAGAPAVLVEQHGCSGSSKWQRWYLRYRRLQQRLAARSQQLAASSTKAISASAGGMAGGFASGLAGSVPRLAV